MYRNCICGFLRGGRPKILYLPSSPARLPNISSLFTWKLSIAYQKKADQLGNKKQQKENESHYGISRGGCYNELHLAWNLLSAFPLIVILPTWDARALAVGQSQTPCCDKQSTEYATKDGVVCSLHKEEGQEFLIYFKIDTITEVGSNFLFTSRKGVQYNSLNDTVTASADVTVSQQHRKKGYPSNQMETGGEEMEPLI